MVQAAGLVACCNYFSKKKKKKKSKALSPYISNGAASSRSFTKNVMHYLFASFPLELNSTNNKL